MSVSKLFRESIFQVVLGADSVDKSRIKFQTGWLFTNEGGILTAGHGFRDINARHGQGFEIKSNYWDKPRLARLIEFGKGIDGECDYAILRLCNTKERIPAPIPISKSIFREDIPVSINIVGAGIAAHRGSHLVHFSGQVQSLGYSYDKDPKRRFVIDIDQNHPPDGMSGGPVCINTGEKGAIAIQVQGATSLFCAQPLSEIFVHSKIFRRWLYNAMECDKSYRWLLCNLDKESFSDLHFNASSKSEKGQIRFVYALRPSNANDVGHKISLQINNNCNAYKLVQEQSVKNITWLETELQKNILLWNYKQITNVYPHATLDIFLDPKLNQIRAATVPLIRLICDLTGNLDYTTSLPFNFVKNSHILFIKLFAPKTEWIPLNIANVKLLLNLSQEYIEAVARGSDTTGTLDSEKQFINSSTLILSNVIHDLMLDVNIFYGIPILRNIYSRPEAAAALCAAKAAFIRSHNLKPSGLPLPLNAEYAILSSCARSSLEAPIDFGILDNIWRTFVKDYLLPSLLDRYDESSPKMSTLEVIESFRRVKKIGGQVSLRKLTRQLNLFKAHEGDLCAVAMVLKLPQKHTVYEQLCTLFQGVKRLNRRTGIFSIEQLPLLCQHIAYVKIFLFRFQR